MGTRNLSGVRRVGSGANSRLFIDFRYVTRTGERCRYRRTATVQNTPAAAAEARRLMQRAADLGYVDEPVANVRARQVTFGQFVTDTFIPLFMPAYRPATRVRYTGLLGQGVLAHFGNVQLAAIDALEMRAFVAKLKVRGIKSKGPTNFVRTVLRAAVEAGALPGLPTLPSFAEKDEKLPETYGESEVECLLSSDAQPWLKLAIALAAFAGCRLGEVLAMEVQDVDLVAGWFTIRRALSDREVMTPKNNKARVVPVAPQLLPHLQTALRSKTPRARLVLNSNGRTPTRQSVLSALKHIAGRLKLPARSFHSLRHFFCSTLIRRGGSVEAVRMLAGHSKMTQTARYVHATSSDLQATIAKLGTAP